MSNFKEKSKHGKKMSASFKASFRKGWKGEKTRNAAVGPEVVSNVLYGL